MTLISNMSESETKAGVVPENSSHEMESSKDKADSCLVEGDSSAVLFLESTADSGK